MTKRKHTRNYIDFKIGIRPIESNSPTESALNGKIINISKGGLKLSLDTKIHDYSLFNISLPIDEDNTSIEIFSKLVWKDHSSKIYGMKFPSLTDDQEKAVKRIINRKKDLNNNNYKVDRRKNDKKMTVPVYRRKEDAEKVKKQDNILILLERLKKYKQQYNGSDIIISPGLRYLKVKISKIFSGSRIVAPQKNKNINLKRPLCIIDFSSVGNHESYTVLNFREVLIKNENENNEIMYTLNFISNNIKKNEGILFCSLGETKHFKNIRKMLRCSKFKDIKLIDNYTIKAKKRRLIEILFDNKRLKLQEIPAMGNIDDILSFSKQHFKGKNYSKRIDRIFSPYSDHFVCYKRKTENIVCYTRYTWHLPGCFLPLMLANKLNSNHHLELNNPDQYNYAEVLGIYKQTLSGFKSFKKCIETLLAHGKKMDLSVTFITYEHKDEKRKELYMNKFGFDDAGVILKYGDFKGKWRLLFGPYSHINPIMNERFINK
ncbi:MAG: PilZ domain-containing protein [Atribacterota bacterium]